MRKSSVTTTTTGTVILKPPTMSRAYLNADDPTSADELEYNR